MVVLDVDDRLQVELDTGGKDWDYRIAVYCEGDLVTDYGSNFDPWSESGRTMLRNIVAARVDGYDSKERVGELLTEAFEDNAGEIQTALD